MGKEKSGFLTPKAIANRIKAKGLQKLRWYCQMCQKQCRDENGFKCHTTSESHQRQLLLFAENPDSYISSFSKEFLDDYMELLSRRFGKKRVHCNIVYQEYISERDHVHMTSTEWETLTDFVKYLGKEGLCIVDDTEKGWFVQYIDRNPETIKRMEAAAAKEKMNLDDEEKTARYIQKQIERAAESEREKPEAEFTDLNRDDENEKVAFAMAAKKKDATFKLPTTSGILQASGSKTSTMTDTDAELSSQKSLKRKSALDEIMETEERRKEKQKRKDHWLHKGIVVKVITKKLGESYYKKKGYIKSIQDHYTALVKMLDSSDTVKLDQAHLETVIPALNKSLLVVNGAYRGEAATLVRINEEKFCCSVRISAGPLTGRIVEGIQYEDISKLHIPDK